MGNRQGGNPAKKALTGNESIRAGTLSAFCLLGGGGGGRAGEASAQKLFLKKIKDVSNTDLI